MQKMDAIGCHGDCSMSIVWRVRLVEDSRRGKAVVVFRALISPTSHNDIQ